jgi:hypothetical protein
MLANRKILQLIINDDASTEVERAEAKRALAEMTVAQSPPSPRRRGRNSNTPQSQEDTDSDVENWYRRLALTDARFFSDSIYRPRSYSTRLAIVSLGYSAPTIPRC